MNTVRTSIALLLAVAASGCRRLDPASIPSNQPTPIVWNAETQAVLSRAADNDIQVLASALESQAESGSVIYVDHNGWVYNPDGTLFLDKDGDPIHVRTKVVAKLNSLKELATMNTVSKVRYRVGGFGYVSDLPDNLKGKDLCPEALSLEIEGIGTLNAVDTTAANREAAAKERAAIYDGMAKLAAANGAAFAAKVDAIGDGLVKVVTATGREIIGRVNGTTVIEAGIAGATSVVQSTIRSADGTETKVVAEGDGAAALKAVDK